MNVRANEPAQHMLVESLPGARPPETVAAATAAPDHKGARFLRPDELAAQPGKIHIVGGPGSGKTVLSRRLAAQLGVPVFELDDVAGAGPAPAFRMQRPLAERLEAVERIASMPGWVTEGTFLWWTDGLFRAADLIIWLDVPLTVAMRRVVARENFGGLLRRYVSGVRQQASLSEAFRALRHPHVGPALTFIRYTWAYYRRAARATPDAPPDLDDGWALTLAETHRQLAPYAGKAVRCKHTEDVEHLLARVAPPIRQTVQEGPPHHD